MMGDHDGFEPFAPTVLIVRANGTFELIREAGELNAQWGVRHVVTGRTRWFADAERATAFYESRGERLTSFSSRLWLLGPWRVRRPVTGDQLPLWSVMIATIVLFAFVAVGLGAAGNLIAASTALSASLLTLLLGYLIWR